MPTASGHAVAGTTRAIPSPNIWSRPDLYELECEAVDRAGVIETAMWSIHDWDGLLVADIGCGSGFHLPRFAVDAATVVGIEPHGPLAQRAAARVAALPTARVCRAGAEATGLADGSVDVAHARWAYFFGPGCEPGLRELERLVRPGGAAFVIDNDATRSTFGRWFRSALPAYDPDGIVRFWTRQGWHRERLDIAWAFDSRAEFESVVRIEFAPDRAALILAEDPHRTDVDYAVDLWWRRY